MRKSKIITMLIVAVIVLLAVVLFVVGSKKTPLTPFTDIIEDVSPILDENNLNNLNVPAGNNTILGNKKDLIASSISAGEELHGAITFTGSVKGGYFFEGNILINILGVNKKVLKSGHATATTDWMTVEPVAFEGDIDFTGLSVGSAYFEIHNDNASGLPENDKSILIPIFIK